MKKLIKAIDDLPFDYDLVDDEIDLHCYTPAGEDWHVYVRNSEELKEYAKNFEPEEEFKVWFEARQRRTCNGIPDVPELWKDQLWKRKTLKALAKKL